MEEFHRTALRIAVLNTAINVLLSVVKITIGVVSSSRAVLSDGLHSAADALGGVVLIAGVKLASRAADARHPYGYERLECVAAVVLAIVIGVTGVAIGWGGCEDMITPSHRQTPRWSALAAPLAAIAVKETMFRYTRCIARRTGSTALMADAWHQRADALSSVGSAIGVVGAKGGIAMLDAAASLLIGGMIVKAAVEIFADAMRKMTDRSCDDETQEALRQCARQCGGVEGVETIKTRLFGNRIYAEMTVCVAATMSSAQAFEVACLVWRRAEEALPAIKECAVHIHPL